MSAPLSLTIGVIGLGNVGSVMANRLAQSGLQVYGYDIRTDRQGALAGTSITLLDSIEQVAMHSDVLILSLPSPEISRDVARHAAPHLHAGAVLVETSTVTSKDITRLAIELSEFPIEVVDAAIIGGVANLARGEITFLIGGDPAAIKRVHSILSVLASDVWMLGPLGAGMAAKVINNAVAHAVMVVLVEAGALARATGVSLDAFYDLMARESGLMRPLTYRFQQLVRHSRYEGGMSTDNARKDSLLALATAQAEGIPLFAIQAAHTVFEMASQQGLGRLDYASIATLWEKWGHFEFGS